MPRGKDAIVETRKIREYILSSDHPIGKHKARVFRAALGLKDSDADFLMSALRDAAIKIDATFGDLDEFGRRYVIDFELTTLYGTAVIRSAWIIQGEDAPRFVTCFVKE